MSLYDKNVVKGIKPAALFFQITHRVMKKYCTSIFGGAQIGER